MKIASLIKWGGLAYIGYKAVSYVSNKVTTAQALSCSVVGVKFNNVNFPYINFIINVQVTNPTNADATATSFVGTLTAPNNNTLGTFNILLNNNTGIVVPANSNAILNVNAQVDVFGIASSILQSGLKATLNAVVVVDGFKLPVTTNIEINNSGVQMN